MISLKAWCGVAVLLLGVALGAAGQARAGTLNFDDLTASGNGNPIHNYGGFSWDNFNFLVGTDSINNNSGFQNGVVSTGNVAYNTTSTIDDPPSLWLNGPGVFTFNSVYLTGVWNDGLNITVAGYNGANLLASETVVVNATHPTLFTFDYVGITSLVFTSSGGKPHGNGYTGAGAQFAMDNLTFNADVTAAVPEPASMISAAAAVAAGLGFGARRRRRAA